MVCPNMLSDILLASRYYSVQQACFGRDGTIWCQVMAWLKGKHCVCAEWEEIVFVFLSEEERRGEASLV